MSVFDKGLLIAGAASAIAIVVLYRSGVTAGFFRNASVAVLVVPLFAAILATLRHLRTLRRRTTSTDSRPR